MSFFGFEDHIFKSLPLILYAHNILNTLFPFPRFSVFNTFRVLRAARSMSRKLLASIPEPELQPEATPLPPLCLSVYLSLSSLLPPYPSHSLSRALSPALSPPPSPPNSVPLSFPHAGRENQERTDGRGQRDSYQVCEEGCRDPPRNLQERLAKLELWLPITSSSSSAYFPPPPQQKMIIRYSALGSIQSACCVRNTVSVIN